MPKIGIVCDSTCDLGPTWLAEHDVVMVPLKVNFGTTTYLDWIELTTDEFYAKLRASDVLPKTSQPSPADFAAVYAELAEQGCEEIISIHLTAALSGTMESALMAAKLSPVPVRAIDTLTVSMGEGLAVIAAVTARDAGGDADAIEAAVRHVVDTGRIFFALDTLDYLVKGGRAGKAAGMAASLLNIKPVLTFNRDGVIEPYKKVKGTGKAIAEMAAAAAEMSAAHGNARLIIGTLHAQAPELVEQLEAAIAATGIEYDLIHSVSVGAVIGTYAGPRAVGAVFYPLA